MIRKYAAFAAVSCLGLIIYLAFFFKLSGYFRHPNERLSLKRHEGFITVKSFLIISTQDYTTAFKLFGNTANLIQNESSTRFTKPRERTTPTTKGTFHRKKGILLWNKVSWMKTTEVSGDVCGSCTVSRNRSLVNDRDTAAVVINALSRTSSIQPFAKRRADQLYVFFASESPGSTLNRLTKKSKLRIYPPHFFNATMTYRRDATFHFSEVNRDVVHLVNIGWRGMESNLTRLLSKKNKTALLVVSNCRFGSNTKNRLRKAQEMVDLGFKLDRFGKCFPHASFMGANLRLSSQFYRVIEKYKFYLSFENSLHCRDYITEKFFYNGLGGGALPVVYGAVKEDYMAVAPPHSFIHVEDFNSTKDLVDYLKYLDRNDTAYMEYFAWRKGHPKEFRITEKPKSFCAICRVLHGIPLNDTRPFSEIFGKPVEVTEANSFPGIHQTIPSIYEWWHGSETKECLAI